MLKLRKSEATETKLELGDYVPIHMLGLERGVVDYAEPRSVQVHRDELYQRIRRQRGEVVPVVQKPRGDLIDVRLRPAAVKKGWTDFSQVANTQDNLVA